MLPVPAGAARRDITIGLRGAFGRIRPATMIITDATVSLRVNRSRGVELDRTVLCARRAANGTLILESRGRVARVALPAEVDADALVSELDRSTIATLLGGH